MKDYSLPINATATTTANNTNSAATVKSGSLEVFSTPMMIALMEEATCNAVSSILDECETTVGTKINVTHDKASGMGAKITALATLTQADGRKLIFEVSATDDSGDIIGSGTIERFVVNSEKFMNRVNGK